MHNLRKLTSIAVYVMLGVAATALHGCAKDDPQGSRDSQPPEFTIGLLAPLTGEIQDVGRDILNGAQLAIEHANTGQQDVRFALRAADAQSSTAMAATQTRRLIRLEDVVAVIAADETAAVKGAVEEAAGRQIPVITSTATTSTLARNSDYLFRVIPSNSAQAQALIALAERLHAKTAAIVFQQNDYAIDLKDLFHNAFTAAGGNIVLEVGFEQEQTDFRLQIDRVKASAADVVLCAAQHVPVARFLVRADAMNVTQPILAGETAFTDKLLSTAGHVSVQFYVTGSALDMQAPTSALSQFLTQYKTRYNGQPPGIYGCYTYDAVRLVTHLVADQGADTGPKLITALRKVTDYPGVTGMITLQGNGEVAQTYQIYTIKDKHFVPFPG